jgi:hypothetical protein
VGPVDQRLREGEEVGGPRDRLSGPEGWLGWLRRTGPAGLRAIVG